MSRFRTRQTFGPSCPSGGIWYSCGFGSKFVGCCRSEACENGCATGNLEPASFNPSSYGGFPDQECSTGSWYTCNSTSPPFLGCCKSNPCELGSCPEGDLAAGFLSNNPAIAASFSPTGGPSSTSTSNPSSSPSSTGAVQPTSTIHSAPIGAIVGGVVGGVLLLCVIIFYIYRRKKVSKSGPLHESHNISEEPPKPSISQLFADSVVKRKSRLHDT